MVDEPLQSGDHVWFTDTRGPSRRMGVSRHPDEGLIVLSLWQNDTCTASFRLRISDAGDLVTALGEAMADALPDLVPEAAVGPPG